MRRFIKISETVFNLQSRHVHMVEMPMFNVQRAITLKVGKPNLQFMCSAHCLIVLYIKFVSSLIKISCMVFNLQSGNKYMVEMPLFNVQRAITPKVGKPELRFMCSTHCLIVLYICVKFGENISDSIRLMERA